MPGDLGRVPLVHQLPYGFSMADAFERLQSIPGVLWLDSVNHPQPGLGRYSFLTADPIRRTTDPSLVELRHWVDQLPGFIDPALPPFQGGVAGVFGYDFNRYLEPIDPPEFDDLPTPPLSFGLYDWTIATCHDRECSWLVSQGIKISSENRLEFDHSRAEQRLEQVLQWLAAPPWPALRAKVTHTPQVNLSAPRFATRRHPKLTSNFSSEGYRQAVAEIVRSIRRGDSFQVNFSQRLLFPATCAAPELYRRLRRENPAPEAGYYDGGGFQVLSSSPETFLRVRDRNVETRPIKGTCRRSGDPDIDAQLARELSASEKDRAENIMIVDLMRNDLSRVCTDDSVIVNQLCKIEPYAFVQHLVSVVRGRLRDDSSLIDLMLACFPGGSITGAPKVESMRKIAELERVARGFYCGSMGYFGCGGMADFNIMIRTITYANGYLQIPVGGGITAASDPEAEERETWQKAEGLLRALPI